MNRLAWAGIALDSSVLPFRDDAACGVQAEPGVSGRALDREKGSKARAATRGGIPQPVSAISITTLSCPARVRQPERALASHRIDGVVRLVHSWL